MSDKKINESASPLPMMVKQQVIIGNTAQPTLQSINNTSSTGCTAQPATSQNASQLRTPLPNKK